MMLRQFLPVGQGAFYIEQFRIHDQKLNVVYDCGSSTPGFDIKREIRSNFDEGEEIDIVFISHLHADHVNGLEYLMKYCHVRNIVFPLTLSEDRIILKIDYLCGSKKHNAGDSVYSFINNPSWFIHNISPETNIYVVNFENKENIDRRRDWYGYVEMDRVQVIQSGENVLERITDKHLFDTEICWEYIPYNFRQDSLRESFYETLSDKLGVVIDHNNIGVYLEQWGDKRMQKIFLEAYRELNKDLNVNSMTLFSGSKNGKVLQMAVNLYDYEYFYRKYSIKRNGCLYFGDYNANKKDRWEELEHCYKDYWDNIGCVQIPHHGSKYSYNDELAEMDAIFIISAGKNNRFGHPHSAVIRDLLFEQKMPCIVTEEKDSEVIMMVDI